ncbi:MAG: GreA/GreB family elongation factor, partial [Bacillota bacterium]
LVFPFDADAEQKKLSILDPIGIAAIGCRLGSVIEVNMSGNKREMLIEKIIYQPESEGNYYI